MFAAVKEGLLVQSPVKSEARWLHETEHLHASITVKLFKMIYFCWPLNSRQPSPEHSQHDAGPPSVMMPERHAVFIAIQVHNTLQNRGTASR